MVKLAHTHLHLVDLVKLRLACVCGKRADRILATCDDCTNPVCDSCRAWCNSYFGCARIQCMTCNETHNACDRCDGRHCNLIEHIDLLVCSECLNQRCCVCSKMPKRGRQFHPYGARYVCDECYDNERYTCIKCGTFDKRAVDKLCKGCQPICCYCQNTAIPRQVWCEECRIKNKCKRCNNVKSTLYSRYEMCEVCILIFERCCVCNEKFTNICDVKEVPGTTRCGICERDGRT
jgi:hypothetical protein